jgi:hypothetical protein
MKLPNNDAKVSEKGGDLVWDTHGDRTFTTASSGTETPLRNDEF